ncbi:hypothetical protein [Lachnotalea glycerini]|uniref:Membrane protein 6-pyruvoyl-tetrahydropterin synthase-related domain-containing protein n=1 Tax=Lachnotalea glycerini TaxID=1763509 RepID=A0A371JEA6_9FIRM|nr:hypothetical protein [Lachnotalea glycerini]RDY31091.1 hypothetical protein CG710_011455 [Lachnotalea glycerini]
MKKRTYIIICAVILIILALNKGNDKYDRMFLMNSFNITNASAQNRYSATIYGDETNAGVFANGPDVNLDKGEYILTIHYKADTNKNYVNITSKIDGNDVVLSEEESCLYYEETSKEIRIIAKKDIENLKFEVEFGGIGTFILESVEIESVENIYNDSLMTVFIFALICTAIGILGYGKNIQNRKEKLEVALALIIITVCSSYILLGNSLIWGHDINYHLNRIEGIKNALLSGQFPVRIHTGLLEGYGYASPFFYPELFLYIPALLRIMGVSLVSAVQAFCILINFMTAYFMYLAAFKISKSRYIGIISSAFYVLSIYHLCDMYTRFALGEVLAMTFIPLIIYGIYELLYGDETKWKYAVAGVTGVLQSHILTMVFTIPLILIACMICIKKLLNKKRFFSCVKAVLACLLLNIWFLIPFLQLMKEDINLEQLEEPVANYALYISQLFESFTGATGTRNVVGAATGNVMPTHIGIILIVTVILALYNIFNKNIEAREERKVVGVLILFGSLTAFATTYLFPWEYLQSIPMLHDVVTKVQFPWRLLAYATAFFSIAGAYGIYYLFKSEELRKLMIIVSLAVGIIPAGMFLDDFNTGKITVYRGETIDENRIAGGEYLYTDTNPDLIKERGDITQTSSDRLLITNYSRNLGSIVLDLENTSTNQEYIEVPLLYYPGYIAELESGTRLTIERGENNVMRIDVPADTKGVLTIKYRGRKLWDLCTAVSILTLLSLLLWNHRNKLSVLLGKRK